MRCAASERARLRNPKMIDGMKLKKRCERRTGRGGDVEGGMVGW